METVLLFGVGLGLVGYSFYLDWKIDKIYDEQVHRIEKILQELLQRSECLTPYIGDIHTRGVYAGFYHTNTKQHLIYISFFADDDEVRDKLQQLIASVEYD